MPDTPEFPRPPQRITIDLMGKRYGIEVRIAPLPDAPKAEGEVVEMPKREEGLPDR